MLLIVSVISRVVVEDDYSGECVWKANDFTNDFISCAKKLLFHWLDIWLNTRFNIFYVYIFATLACWTFCTINHFSILFRTILHSLIKSIIKIK